MQDGFTVAFLLARALFNIPTSISHPQVCENQETCKTLVLLPTFNTMLLLRHRSVPVVYSTESMRRLLTCKLAKKPWSF